MAQLLAARQMFYCAQHTHVVRQTPQGYGNQVQVWDEAVAGSWAFVTCSHSFPEDICGLANQVADRSAGSLLHTPQLMDTCEVGRGVYKTRVAR